MINTVLGKIDAKELGVTLCHEHIMWDPSGAVNKPEYNKDQIVDAMLPYLLELKELGCHALFEATPNDCGRDIEVFKECSRKSGLKIITCVGAWDGMESGGKYISSTIKNKNIDEIVKIWSREFYDGINGTEVKPGFIKIALGDSGVITELQEKMLRAAIRTSLQTKLPLQCHCVSSKIVKEVVEILIDEDLSFDKFIWLHADIEKDYSLIENLTRKGMWVSFDWALSVADDFKWHIETIKDMTEKKIINRLLISQDAGFYVIGSENKDNTIRKYGRVFSDFVPKCLELGVSQQKINKIFIENPSIAFDV